jgi:ADP-heptose:LPS heptosyltransferase
MRPLYVAGMHGLGDNLHQRAVMRQLVERRSVWLETPWPCLYEDIHGLNVVGKGSHLRTQARNAAREADRYSKEPVPKDAELLEVRYMPDDVRRLGSVLAAMCKTCGVDYAKADFRLDVPSAWRKKGDAFLRKLRPQKPLMIFRPLVERAEWGGNAPRNPDPYAYRDLYLGLRDRYHVLSIADLEPHAEWMVGERVQADTELHRGELDIETLAAVFAQAALVFTAPGFPVILSQAVGVPVIVPFGGYENSSSYSAGARYSPYLGLDVIRPCQCFSHRHDCDKRMDVAAARTRIQEFLR